MQASFRFYNRIWKAALPLVGRHPRLSADHEARRLRSGALPRSDIWIQSASAGEAYLSWSLVKGLKPASDLRVLATTNTPQGMEILRRAASDLDRTAPGIHMNCAFFPYDMPDIMRKATAQVRPEVTVLLETEIWPGLMGAIRESKGRILIVNGRIRAESLRRYRLWPSFWRRLKPDRVLAVSNDDADRFNRLFGHSVAGVMPNIKFDRFEMPSSDEEKSNPLATWIPAGTPFVVLGSIRKEEEADIEKLIEWMRRRTPHIVIGMFPRHMQRISRWQKHFEHNAIPFHLRSQMRAPARPGSVLLWDMFGELVNAYRVADAAFVGGSLAPLGGQNFLEPLSCGIVPVIGPSWSNFYWVGRQLFSTGMVRMGSDWEHVARLLLESLETVSSRKQVICAVQAYIDRRKGGTQAACDLIHEYLDLR